MKRELPEEFKPAFEFYGGSMGGGKTNALIHSLYRAEKANLQIQAFKKSEDIRHSYDYINSNNGKLDYPAIPVNSTREMVSKLNSETNIIGIDEVQFWDEEIINFVEKYRDDKRIIASGVQIDFRRKPFPLRSLEDFTKDSDKSVGDLMALANKISLFWPICTYKDDSGKICGNTAYCVQRWDPDGNPSLFNGPTLGVGKVVSDECEKNETLNQGLYAYAVRCNEHYSGFKQD